MPLGYDRNREAVRTYPHRRAAVTDLLQEAQALGRGRGGRAA